MDWPRAKTMLIVCFLVLNLVLAFNLYIEPILTGDADNISPERFESIINVLRQNNVEIEVAVPRNAPRLPFYRVALLPYTVEEIFTLRNGLLGPDAAMTSVSAVPRENDPSSFVAESEDIVVTALGYFSYYNRGLFLSEASPDMEAEEARDIAAAFLLSRFGTIDSYSFDNARFIEGMGYRVEYVQIHDDTPIYPGHIMVLVKPEGVVSIWQLRLNVLSAGGQDKRVVSAADALLSMLSHRLTIGETGAMTVREIQLGYYSRVYDTFESWQAAPVWRIRTDRGDYFVNAHSGIIEE